MIVSSGPSGRVSLPLHRLPGHGRCRAGPGRLRRIDAAAALALPGVLAVVTAADIADIQKPWPARMPSPVPGTTVRHGARHTLPGDKVRHVGEVVAAVVAESRALAEVEYEALPVVASPAAALVSGAPRA